MTEPSRRERYRPAELVVLSAVIAVFGGLVTLMSTRDIVFALIALGVVFIISLVTIALLVLAMKPKDGEDDEPQGQNGPVL